MSVVGKILRTITQNKKQTACNKCTNAQLAKVNTLVLVYIYIYIFNCGMIEPQCLNSIFSLLHFGTWGKKNVCAVALLEDDKFINKSLGNRS